MPLVIGEKFAVAVPKVSQRRPPRDQCDGLEQGPESIGCSLRIERCMEAGEVLIKNRFFAGRRSELAAAIAGLRKLDAAALAAQWRALYGSAPPLRITTGLLIGAVAYRLQEQALGGLAPSTRRFLKSAAEAHTNETPALADVGE